jgi:hypothetical protein
MAARECVFVWKRHTPAAELDTERSELAGWSLDLRHRFIVAGWSLDLRQMFIVAGWSLDLC